MQLTINEIDQLSKLEAKITACLELLKDVQTTNLGAKHNSNLADCFYHLTEAQTKLLRAV